MTDAIRRLDDRDANALKALGGSPDWMRQSAIETFGACAGSGKISGFVMVRLVSGDAEIMDIRTALAARGKGVGTRLLAHVMTHLQAHAARRLFLEVDQTNAAALALYRKLNFQVCGERRNYYRRSTGNGDAFVMVHKLDADGMRP